MMQLLVLWYQQLVKNLLTDMLFAYHLLIQQALWKIVQLSTMDVSMLQWQWVVYWDPKTITAE